MVKWRGLITLTFDLLLFSEFSANKGRRFIALRVNLYLLLIFRETSIVQKTTTAFSPYKLFAICDEAGMKKWILLQCICNLMAWGRKLLIYNNSKCCIENRFLTRSGMPVNTLLSCGHTVKDCGVLFAQIDFRPSASGRGRPRRI